MDHIDQNMEATAHLIEVEPVALFGCTMTELKYISMISTVAWFVLLFILTIPWAGLVMTFLCVPLAFFFGTITTWRLSKRIKKAKVGKPHHYYIHKIERGLLAKLGLSPWPTHVGRYRLGRTIQSGNSSS